MSENLGAVIHDGSRRMTIAMIDVEVGGTVYWQVDITRPHLWGLGGRSQRPEMEPQTVWTDEELDL